MKYSFLPLEMINSRFEPRLSEAVARVVASGRYIGGPEVEAVETTLAEMCEVDYAVGVSTGLDALHLILKALIELKRLKKGDGVIVPANSFIASALAIVHAGLRPVFADPSIDDYLLHAETIERLANDGVRAVMPVDLYGRIAISQDMLEVCRRNSLIIIEDAAQAIGAWRQDDGETIVRPGSACDAAAFSFYPAKNIGALGDGGAVVTNDCELAAMVRTLANYGERNRYESVVAGYNCRLDPIQAAVLNVKLPSTQQENEARRNNAHIYGSLIQEGRGLLLPSAPMNGDAVHQYVVRCAGIDRDSFRRKLLERGVETGLHYPVAIPSQPAMAPYIDNGDHWPVAESLSSQVVSLPVSSATSEEEVHEIADIINNVLNNL